MRRPILNFKPGIRNQIISTTVPLTNSIVGLSGASLEKRLRIKRSNAYMEAMTKLDVGGAVWSREMIDELIQTISNEFPELKPTQLPIGIIAKCHLGDPFETHILDRALEIVEHYKFGQVLPSGMEKGRALALHPSYDYIEVYSDSLCAVSKNGNVSIIKG